MSDEEIPAPNGWRTVDDTPDDFEKNHAEKPALFEHEQRPLGVKVLSDDPVESGIWRVDLMLGEQSDSEAIETVERGIRGREEALSAARDLMEALNDQGMAHIESALEKGTNPIKEAPESDE